MDKRDEKGRYLKGRSGGPGRPVGNCSEHWNQLFRVKTGRHFNRLYNALISKAVGGDMKALIYVFDRLLGKQTDVITVKQEEVRDMESIRQQFNELFRKD